MTLKAKQEADAKAEIYPIAQLDQTTRKREVAEHLSGKIL